MAVVKDSGHKTLLESGSHKDIALGRGRYDLLPLATLASILDSDKDLEEDAKLNTYKRLLLKLHFALIEPNFEAKRTYIKEAIVEFVYSEYPMQLYREKLLSMVKNLAVLYEAGANKYAARDWEKGRPMEIFFDSAIRHLTQYFNGEEDEDHGSAFIWNLVSCLDTISRMPSMVYTLEQITSTK